MGIRSMHRFAEIAGTVGVSTALRRATARITRFRTRIRVEQFLRYGRHHAAELDPFRTIWIDPQSVHRRNEKLIAKSQRHLTHVIGGDWDRDLRPFGDHLLVESMHERFIDGQEWRDTKLYQAVVEGDEYWREIETVDEFDTRCRYLESLYASIRDEGYRTQAELSRLFPRTPGEVKVQIGRDGTFFYLNGKHRLAIATVLGLDQIPVQVLVRHPEWQAIRDDIARGAEPTTKQSSPSEDELHPDLAHPKRSSLYPYLDMDPISLVK